ncbi:hypothetical protein J1N35_005878 [Gossypium stocksii]|uniref:Uncharacterized protein n=1 Tax=Gossypium stocksii TaxID=47602 RepID=A0A9D4AJE1_9ROSI|nr:hypothetical protein J1N35_005878 [Gossypium stocksii]
MARELRVRKMEIKTKPRKPENKEPLKHYEQEPLPENFPKVLDLANFQVFELCHQYLVQYELYIGYLLDPQYRDYRMKLVFLHSNTDCDENIMVALFGYLVEGLTIMMFGENKKIVLENVGDLRILSHPMGSSMPLTQKEEL